MNHSATLRWRGPELTDEDERKLRAQLQRIGYTVSGDSFETEIDGANQPFGGEQ